METPQQNKPNNQPSPQPQNKPQNLPQNPPLKPYDKFLAKKTEKPAEKKPEKFAEKTDDKKMEKQPMIVVGVLVLVALAWFFIYQYQARKEASLIETPGTEEEAKTQDGKKEEVKGQSAIRLDDLVYEVKTFYSEELGVTFNYVTPSGIAEGRTEATTDDYVIHFLTRIDGNKIYLDETNLVRPWPAIEVFEKDEDATLKEAIEEEFLQGVSREECFVVDMPVDPANPDYVTAKIFLPQLGLGNASRVCGPDGTDSYVSYFMMNTKIPEKFIFVNAYLDTIAVSDLSAGATWSSSVRILK